MFTGIIQEVKKIVSLTPKNKGVFLVVDLPKGWKLKEGESVSINGICSTVRKVYKNTFEVEYMSETIEKTTVSDWHVGLAVNLEKSLKFKKL